MLLPVAIFGVAGAYVLVDKEREATERRIHDRLQGVLAALHSELQATIGALEVLASSTSLDRDDLEAFRSDAQRALAARRDEWVNVLVSDPQTAEMLLNLLIPVDSPLSTPRDAQTIRDAARSGKPSVSQVVMGPVLNAPVFAVRVPVVREGKVKYILSAVVPTSAMTRLLQRQAFPGNWTVAVLDGNYRFVARLPAPAGGSEFASESLRKALESSEAGWERGTLLDGTEIYRAFRRAQMGAWSASIAVPRSVVDESLRVVWLLVAGFAAAAALGLAIAWSLATQISRPIAALAAAAPALGRGEPLALPPPSPVTEVQDLARALGEAAATLHYRDRRQQVAEQALRSADRAKDEFLAMLGHELRNPLAAVSNATQMLRVAGRDPALLDNVSDILGRQVVHMTHLVNDLLDAGRVAGGKVRLDCEPVDVAGITGDLVQIWKKGGRFKDHELVIDVQPVWANADRARVEQILSNLLDNALKYTPAGGRLSVMVRPQGNCAVLEVSDTGEGIAPDLIDRIFDLFVQGEPTLARERGGLGIGLTLAKHLVELHGGHIHASSEGIGKGARFVVELPAIDPPASSPAPAPTTTEMQMRRILLVEDNRDARESLAVLLRLDGHDVLEAANGFEGVAAAVATTPDIALVDVGLPDIDGYEVAQRLRSNPVTADIFLVAVTGYGSEEDRRRALDSGFDEHLVKPADLKSLEALFQSLPNAKGKRVSSTS
jgi:signal transduction histidine kinase/CheY-like chemotaxis protein